MDVQKIIRQANQAKFSPSQKHFDLLAKEYIHSGKPKPVKKTKAVTGRYKRHLERVARGAKAGFGKGYSAPEVSFRVEFAWCDEQGEEDEWQIHWVSCRKFSGKEYQFMKKYFNGLKETWGKGETIESEFVLRYVANWLILNREKQHLNMAFIFPTSKIGNETIREPLYQVRWTAKLAEYKMHTDLAVVLKNSIWHEKSEN